MKIKKLLFLNLLIPLALITGCSLISTVDNLDTLQHCKSPISHENNKTNDIDNNLLEYEGDKHFLKNNFQEAFICYKEDLEIRSQAVGPKHQSLIRSLYNLASVYEANEKYDEAEKSYITALNILQHQSQHQTYNKYLGFLAALYFQKHSKSTIKNLQISLIAFELIHDPNNIRVAAINHQLAIQHLGSKQYQEAEIEFKKALAITQSITGEEHPYYAKTLNDYSKLLQLTKRENQASKLVAQAEHILNFFPKKRLIKLYQNN